MASLLNIALSTPELLLSDKFPWLLIWNPQNTVTISRHFWITMGFKDIAMDTMLKEFDAGQTKGGTEIYKMRTTMHMSELKTNV
jgi:hypothetical protein